MSPFSRRTLALACALTLGHAAAADAVLQLAPGDPLPRVPDGMPKGAPAIDGNPLTDATGYLILGVAELAPWPGAGQNDSSPFLISRFELGPFELSLEGFDLFADMLPSPIWRGGLTASTERHRDPAGTHTLLGTEPLGASTAVGVFAGVEVPNRLLDEGLASARISVHSSTNDARRGNAATLDIDYFFAATFMWRVGIAARATFANNAWLDSRYSLTSKAAGASGREPYRARGGWLTYGLSAYTIVSLSPSFGVFARVARSNLLGDAKASPLVANDEQFFRGVGLFYLF